MPEAQRTPRVVVVGAGIAGLVSALVLAHRGLDVTLVESAATPGGKIRQVQVDGVGVDSGPTVFTMRWVLDQMLQEMGTSLQDIVQLEPLNVLARHAWDGSPQTLDLFSDTARTADAIAQFSSPQESRRFLKFCQQAQRLYATLEKPYIRSERPDLLSMVGDLGLSGMATLTGLGPFASLWSSLSRHFHDPRLQQLFGRYATYCGSSPWLAPATLMLVAQVELDGVWVVSGGMFQIAQALAQLGEKHGVKARYNSPCARILTKGGKVNGVQLSTGETLERLSMSFSMAMSLHWVRVCWAMDSMLTTRRLARPNVLFRHSPCPCMRRHKVFPWFGTMFFSTRTIGVNSMIFFKNADCRRKERCMFVHRTAVTQGLRNRVWKEFCASSTRQPMATALHSTPRRYKRAKQAAWP